MNSLPFPLAMQLRERLPWFLLLWAVTAPWLLFPERWPALAALAALALLAGFIVLRRRDRLAPTAFDLPLLVYLGLCAVALLASPLPADSQRRMTTLLVGLFGYFGLVTFLARQSDGRALAAAVRLVPLLGAGVALAGLLTVSWPSRFLLDLQIVTERLPHLGGEFSVHHNPLAAALVLLVLPGLFAWRRIRSRAGRWLAGAALILMLVVLALTQSRNGFASLAVGLIGGLLWQRGRYRWLIGLFACLLVVPLLLGALPGGAYRPVQQSLSWLDESSKAGFGSDQSWLARLEMWRAALQLMGDYPVVGAGLYQFEAVSRANEIYRTIRPDIAFSHAHNLWLQSGTGLGWPGWLAAALLWLAVLDRLGRATENAPPEDRWTGVALGAALCGYLTFNTFDVLALEQRAGLLIWVLLALIAAFVQRHSPARALLFWHRLHLAPLLLLFLLLPWLPRNLAHLQLDRARLAGSPHSLPAATGFSREDHRRLGLLYALQGQEGAALQAWQHDAEAVTYLAGQGLRATFQEQDPEGGLAWYARALALDPAAGAVYYWQGDAYERSGQDSAALAAFRRAVTYGEGEKLFGHGVAELAWERQGLILAEQEAWEEARAAFAEAVALAPGEAHYRQLLAGVEMTLEQMRQDTGNVAPVEETE